MWEPSPRRQAAKAFLAKLRASPEGRHVVQAWLFGSVARGDDREESDIDLLVVGTGNLHNLERACSDLSFDLMLQNGERVSTVVYCPHDLQRPHYFLRSVLPQAEEVFRMEDEVVRRQEAEDYLALAREYLALAETACAAGGIRAAVDLAHNAAELCAKGLLLVASGSFPKTHGGIVNQFGEMLVRSGRAQVEDGRALRRLTDVRGKARYDPHAVLLPAHASEALATARTFIGLLNAAVSAP